MAGVVIRDLRKAYGALEVMSSISLDIDDGEFVVLVGPSGCGKSTLLRMIAGLEEVTSGEIEIDGEVMNDVSPGDRDIAMVFQNYALYPHMTVERNMAFSLRLDRVPKTEIRERVARAARILGLESLLDRYPRNLSGGQRQRVAMGRAIVRDPVVFLFDEPLSNLDAKLRVQMRAEIKELHQKLRTTIVYVTHDQIEAMTLADKVVVMKEGHIEQQGSPLELYDTPQTVFVAGFIGSPAMNLVNGRVKTAGTRVPRAGLTVMTEDGVEYPLPPDMTLPEGLEVTVGFRPEHISLDAAGLEARVVVVEPTGAETHVVLRIGDQPITAVFRERYRLRPDESVHVMPDVMRLHIFDRATGQRL